MTRVDEASFQTQSSFGQDHFGPYSVQKQVDKCELNRIRDSWNEDRTGLVPIGISDGDSVAKHRARIHQVVRDRPKKRRHHLSVRVMVAEALSHVFARTRNERLESADRWLKAFEELGQAEVGFDLWEDFAQKEKAKNLRNLSRAESQDEVLSALEFAGLRREARQLRQYLIGREDEFEDGEFPGIRFESLKAVCRFLISNRDLPHSAIKADSDGYADLEWYLSSRRIENDIDNMCWINGGGQIVLRFVTPNLIEFAMLSGPWLDDAERLSLSGTMSHSKMRVILDMFSERMISYYE